MAVVYAKVYKGGLWFTENGLFLVFVTGYAYAVPCYDLSKGEPRSLSGKLMYKVFPGPPDYEDVAKGDEPLPAYILELSSPICIEGDEFADPNKYFSTVHVWRHKDAPFQFQSFVNENVTVNLSEPYGAHNGHHHAPLVSQVVAVNLVSEKPGASDANLVRQFYLALGLGDGEEAAKYVTPSKRGKGNYDPKNMTAFYSSLRERLKLADENGVMSVSPNEYEVRYTYTSAKGSLCQGHATVKTVVIEGVEYIQSIKANC